MIVLAPSVLACLPAAAAAAAAAAPLAIIVLAATAVAAATATSVAALSHSQESGDTLSYIRGLRSGENMKI